MPLLKFNFATRMPFKIYTPCVNRLFMRIYFGEVIERTVSVGWLDRSVLPINYLRYSYCHGLSIPHGDETRISPPGKTKRRFWAKFHYGTPSEFSELSGQICPLARTNHSSLPFHPSNLEAVDHSLPCSQINPSNLT